MKAYILPSGVTITPFNEPASDTLVLSEPLKEIQDRVFRDRGLEPVRIGNISEIRDDEYFLTYDNVFLTRRAFRDFYKKALNLGRTCAMALPDCTFVERYRALQGVRDATDAGGRAAHAYRVWYVKGKGATELENAEPLIIKLKEFVWNQPIPPNMFRKKSFVFPVTTSIAFHVNHWVNLLWANQLGIIVKWVEQITEHPFWTTWKLIKSLLIYIFSGFAQLFRYESLSIAFGGTAWRVAVVRAFNKIGKNCEIHPSAILHFCIVGDNVKIGPQSYIFGSVIGDNVIIEEKTKIILTSLGAGCYVSQITILNGVAAYPDGDVCIDGAHFCLAGRNVKLTGLARPLDVRTDGPIKVVYNGKAEPVGQEILGSCFGHGCFIGPDIYILPGREIPNGAIIIQPPGRVLVRVPRDVKPGVPMVIERGTLRPYDPQKDN
jgi:acetyltransferase-like isoleucine patch superfamily enzyme